MTTGSRDKKAAVDVAAAWGVVFEAFRSGLVWWCRFLFCLFLNGGEDPGGGSRCVINAMILVAARLLADTSMLAGFTAFPSPPPPRLPKIVDRVRRTHAATWCF